MSFPIHCVKCDYWLENVDTGMCARCGWEMVRVTKPESEVILKKSEDALREQVQQLKARVRKLRKALLFYAERRLCDNKPNQAQRALDVDSEEKIMVTIDELKEEFTPTADKLAAARKRIEELEARVGRQQSDMGKLAMAIGLDGWEYGAKDVADRFEWRNKRIEKLEAALAAIRQLADNEECSCDWDEDDQITTDGICCPCRILGLLDAHEKAENES